MTVQALVPQLARGRSPARPPVGVRRRFRRSRAGRWVIGHGRALLTGWEIRRHPRRFDGVETCCLFIGHVKSGGSLLGAIIDAHPDAVLADEMDVVALAASGLDRQQIFTLLLRGARREARNGRVTARRLTAYSLAVPGQWQGRCEQLRVIGDSRAGPTTRALGSNPDGLVRLGAVMGRTRLAFVHVVRDPYEPIGAMVRRSGRSVPNAIADHREQCRRLTTLREQIPTENLLTIRYEDVVADPRRQVRGLLEFLGLTVGEDHLDACVALVHPAPVRERDRIAWTAQERADVDDVIARFDFLAGYGFEG